jgi:HK97 family phage prohead protease
MSKHIERRFAHAEFQVRDNADGTVGVRGYAAVFDSEAHDEVIRPAAFNRSVAQADDVKLKVNHTGVPLARTKSGTMQIGVDDRGLWFDVSSLDMSNPTVQELVSAMRRGDMDQCSFAGYFLDAPRNSATGIREVREVKLTDVSVVTDPWYEDTEADLTGDRNFDRALVSVRSLSNEQRTALLAQLDGDGAGGDEPPAAPPATDEPDEPADEPRMFTVAEARALLGN